MKGHYITSEPLVMSTVTSVKSPHCSASSSPAIWRVVPLSGVACGMAIALHGIASSCYLQPPNPVTLTQDTVSRAAIPAGSLGTEGIGCPLSRHLGSEDKSHLPLIPACVSHHHKDKPFPWSLSPACFSLYCSTQPSSDSLLCQSPSMRALLRSADSLQLHVVAEHSLDFLAQTGSPAVIRGHCPPGSPLLPRQFPLPQPHVLGIECSFLIHVVPHFCFC